ncbi:hypothetical protein PFICI_11054 [Pestalotiopsis fici W106-1]|uniref:Tautomerase cis-CaaD-like domain-containing protein n=1 Tax=Pestalotiopsis fici (strain W106-1 / CGMCC3.15140) TaxID=1229662 RepID=W3WTL1_PESFW|nr:uncharacterized protein PFICI_11054 [Pestalotiopsis fici W106-1]ETS77180.1 hypothetical protein PFICI_11054 [Pestalotiopsis fici W106-1]
MPKWVFHHTVGAFTNNDKKLIAHGMTKIYTSVGLPAFYCHAHFIELQPDSIYAGGETPQALTTLSIYHIARGFADKNAELGFMKALDDILRPILKTRSIEWESAIYEANRDLWRINGLVPPATGSELEKKWFEANKVTDEEELLVKQLASAQEH